MVNPKSFLAGAGNQIDVCRKALLTLCDSTSMASRLSILFLLLCLVVSGCGGGWVCWRWYLKPLGHFICARCWAVGEHHR